MKLFAGALALVFSTAALGADYLRTDNITSNSGGPVAFPAGVTAPSTQVGEIHAGTAALTLTAGTNVAAVVTPVTLKYYRIGATVCAYGQVSIDPTSSATASVFTLTLPVSRGVFTGTGGATGSAGILGATTGMCLATNAAATVTCNYVSGGTAVELVPVHFCYAYSGN
jgi:hypothetical protein